VNLYSKMNTEPKAYIVGGYVRDKFLNIPSKDIDYAVEAESFEDMKKWVETIGKIYLCKPEYYTIRAQVGKEARDYVLCRKDGAYSDGRRPDSIEAGSLMDDLSRRDFTVNAMALDKDDNLIDPFNGFEDLRRNLLRCVGSARIRFEEDSLRMLRAMRFHITKGFKLDREIEELFREVKFCQQLSRVSVDRRRDELDKCFKFDTIATINFMSQYQDMMKACFADGLWLKPTTEKRK
jgi:tRNA nucleotidyltransferase (CCA-adding enzyme)